MELSSLNPKNIEAIESPIERDDINAQAIPAYIPSEAEIVQQLPEIDLSGIDQKKQLFAKPSASFFKQIGDKLKDFIGNYILNEPTTEPTTESEYETITAALSTGETEESSDSSPVNNSSQTEADQEAEAINTVQEELSDEEFKLTHNGLSKEEWEGLLAWLRANGFEDAAAMLESDPNNAAELLDLLSNPQLWLDELHATAEQEYDADKEGREKVEKKIADKVAEENGLVWNEQKGCYESDGMFFTADVEIDGDGNVSVYFREIYKNDNQSASVTLYFETAYNIYDHRSGNTDGDNFVRNLNHYGLELSEEELAYFDTVDKRQVDAYNEIMGRLGLSGGHKVTCSDQIYGDMLKIFGLSADQGLSDISESFIKQADKWQNKMWIKEDGDYVYLDPSFFACAERIAKLYNLLSLLAILSDAKIKLKQQVLETTTDYKIEKAKFSVVQAMEARRGNSTSTIKYNSYTLQKFVSSHNNRTFTNYDHEAKEDAHDDARDGWDGALNYISEIATWTGSDAIDRDEQRKHLHSRAELEKEYQQFQQKVEKKYEEVLGKKIDYDTGDPFDGLIDDVMQDVSFDELVDTEIGGDKWDIKQGSVTNPDGSHGTGIRDRLVAIENIRKLWYIVAQARSKLKESVSSAITGKDLSRHTQELLNSIIDDTAQFEQNITAQIVNQLHSIASTHNAYVETRNAADEADDYYWWGSIACSFFAIAGRIMRYTFDAIVATIHYYEDDAANFSENNSQIAAEKLAMEVAEAKTEMGKRVLSSEEEAAKALDELEKEQWLVISMLDDDSQYVLDENGNIVLRSDCATAENSIKSGSDDMWNLNQSYIAGLRERLTQLQNIQRLIIMLMSAKVNFRNMIYKMITRGEVAVQGMSDVDAMEGLFQNKIMAFEFKKNSIQQKALEHNKELAQYRNMCKMWVSSVLSIVLTVVAIIVGIFTFGTGTAAVLAIMSVALAAGSLGGSLGQLIMNAVWRVDDHGAEDEEFFKTMDKLRAKGKQEAWDYLNDLNAQAKAEIDKLGGGSHFNIGDSQWAISSETVMDLNNNLTRFNVLMQLITLLQRAKNELKNVVLASTTGISAEDGVEFAKSALKANFSDLKAAFGLKEQMVKDIISLHNQRVMQDQEMTRAWVSVGISIAGIAIGAAGGAASAGLDSAASAGAEAGAAAGAEAGASAGAGAGAEAAGSAAAAAVEGGVAAGGEVAAAGATIGQATMKGVQYGLAVAGLLNSIINLCWSIADYANAENLVGNTRDIDDMIDDIYKVNKNSTTFQLDAREKEIVSGVKNGMVVGIGGGDITANLSTFAALRDKIESIYNVYTLMGMVAQARTSLLRQIAGILGMATGSGDATALEAINDRREMSLKNLDALKDRVQAYCDRKNQMNQYLLNVYMSAATAVISIASFCLVDLPKMSNGAVPDYLGDWLKELNKAIDSKGSLSAELVDMSDVSKTANVSLKLAFGESFDGSIGVADLAGAAVKLLLSPDLWQYMMLEAFMGTHDNKTDISTKTAQAAVGKKSQAGGTLNYYDAKASADDQVTGQLEMHMSQMDKLNSLNKQKYQMLMAMVRTIMTSPGYIRSSTPQGRPITRTEDTQPAERPFGSSIGVPTSFNFQLPDLEIPGMTQLTSSGISQKYDLGIPKLKLDPTLTTFNPFMMALLFSTSPSPTEEKPEETAIETAKSARPLQTEVAQTLSVEREDASAARQEVAVERVNRQEKVVRDVAYEAIEGKNEQERIQALAALVAMASTMAEVKPVMSDLSHQAVSDLVDNHPAAMLTTLAQASPEARNQVLTLMAQQLPNEYERLAELTASVAAAQVAPAAAPRMEQLAPNQEIHRTADASLAQVEQEFDPEMTKIAASLTDKNIKASPEELATIKLKVLTGQAEQAAGILGEASQDQMAANLAATKKPLRTMINGLLAKLADGELKEQLRAALKQLVTTPQLDPQQLAETLKLVQAAAQVAGLGESALANLTAAAENTKNTIINREVARVVEEQLVAGILTNKDEAAVIKAVEGAIATLPPELEINSAHVAGMINNNIETIIGQVKDEQKLARLDRTLSAFKEIAKGNARTAALIAHSQAKIARALGAAEGAVQLAAMVPSAEVGKDFEELLRKDREQGADDRNEAWDEFASKYAGQPNITAPAFAAMIGQQVVRTGKSAGEVLVQGWLKSYQPEAAGLGGEGAKIAQVERVAQQLVLQTERAAKQSVDGEADLALSRNETIKLATILPQVASGLDLPQVRKLSGKEVTTEDLQLVLQQVVDNSEGLQLTQPTKELLMTALANLSQIKQNQQIQLEAEQFIAQLAANPDPVEDFVAAREPVKKQILTALQATAPEMVAKLAPEDQPQFAQFLYVLTKDARIDRPLRTMAAVAWENVNAAMVAQVSLPEVSPPVVASAALEGVVKAYDKKLKENEAIITAMLDKSPAVRPERGAIATVVAGAPLLQKEKREKPIVTPVQPEAKPVNEEYAGLATHNGLMKQVQDRKSQTPLA